MSAPDSAPVVHGDELTPPTRPRTTWAEVEALAAILEPEAFDPNQAADEGWRKATKNRASAHAAKVLAAGYTQGSDVHIVAYASLHETVRRFLAGEANRGYLTKRFEDIEEDLQRAVVARRFEVRGSVSGGGNA